MFDDIFYAVRFDNEKYYTATGFNPNDSQESEKIEDAALYGLDWQIPKDLYLLAYLSGKSISYEVVKVKVTKSYEIIKD